MAEHNRNKPANNRLDLPDLKRNKFGKWIVMKELAPDDNDPRHRRRALCRCECGRTKTVDLDSLLRGASTSCGRHGLGNYRHGMAATKEHNAWSGMKSRCGNSDNLKYGGRGIKACAGYTASFEVFFADLGESPSPAYSVDRINNNGNYSCGKCQECIVNGWPMNVRWADLRTQSRNKRNNVMIEHQGQNLIVADWAARVGIKRQTILFRLAHGWTPEQALTIQPTIGGRIKIGHVPSNS